MSDSPTPRRGRGRRPADQVRSEVLAAAGRLLLDEGIQAITFERIAREAGSSKTTLYKWWRSPGALAAEAYFAHSEPALEFNDTGDLHTDLVAQITSFINLLTTGGAGKPISELIGTAQSDPDLAEAWKRTYAHPRRDLARKRLEIARRNGELKPDTDIDILIDQLWGACYHRMLILMTPLEDLDIQRLVTYSLNGVHR